MAVEVGIPPSSEELTRSLGELVAERGTEAPDAVAIEDGDRRLTYAELNDAAAGVAAELRAAGVGVEEPVGVCMSRSWQAICSFLGVLRAGAAYVPIDPDHPPARRQQLLALAGARLVLADSAAVGEGDAGADEPAAGGDRLAYVLFTSGSSGTPKGVEVTHRNLVHLLLSGHASIPRGEDTVLHVAPLGFDLAAKEIWGTLVNGGRLVVAPPGRPDPAQLGRLILTREVTALTVSTGLLHELVRAALPSLGRLRSIGAGGDVLSPRVAAELREAHPSVRLLHNYGPTETSITASSYEVTETDGSEQIPIGRPLPGYRFELRDEAGSPVGPGTAGELWIGGPGVARGYRGDPESTAAAFGPDPDGGGRRYRTGDRVLERPDGELLFLGRIDDQAKISGHRVEPGEVEHALASDPRVREAAVVAREDVPGHKRLVGYAALRAGASASSGQLRGRLAELLPEFMVPSAIELLRSLPRNERGKVDRAALPGPARHDGTGQMPSDAEPLAALMAEVLRLDSVGPEEDFFGLGGTSLLAIQLVGRLRDRLGLPVDVEAVFEAPTPLRLAERLAGGRGAADELPPLRPGPPGEVAPVTAAQRRAWLFGRLHPESTAYQFAAFFQLDGRLDRDALEAALGDLIERHEILRTSIEERDGEPVQVVHERRDPPLEAVDLRDRPHEAWARLVRDRVRRRIEPSGAPLLRWTLVRLGETRWRLIHVEHHLIHDGWSFRVLTAELAELYSARVEGRAAALPEPALQFRDYAHWERVAHAGPAVRRQVEHWARELEADPPLIELPGAGPRPERESFAGGLVRRRLDAELTGRLRELATASGTTLFMVALAGFLIQLRRYSGLDRIQVGSGLANRGDPAAEGLIGMTVNTVGLRVDLSGDPTVAELLARVRRAALDAYANAEAPFEAVVEALRPRRDPSRSPLIQALFSFNDAPRGEERWSGLRARVVHGLPDGTAKADLNVIGTPERDGRLTFVWEHSELLADAAADRLAGHHAQLLEQLADRPGARLSELDLRSDAERAEAERWNATRRSYDRAATVHGLVAAQARRTPDATAVVDGEERLSYAELTARAASVAGALRERGVRPGDRVGVLLPRSAGSVAAQLGVLAAGAAYVPLDGQHPPDRVAAVLRDAGAEVALTDARLRRRLPVGVAALEISAALGAHPVVAATAGPDELAYLIYTSGSTGTPKGVETLHRNVVRLVDDPDFAELGDGAIVLHAASPAFDAATLEIWGPLANGGTVACLAEQPSPDAVAAAIERWGTNTLWLTAGLFHELVDRRPECLASVRHLLSGGDVLSPEHVGKALAALPAGARLSNGYGPTETTTFATTHDLWAGEEVDGPIPIGRPIQGTTCRVLDPDGREAPVGVAGELAIGGDGVARGYRGDPELTAARFRPDPHEPGAVRYLSGDRVRRLADGSLEFLGRADRQLKLRGNRVEPAEAETCLRAHQAVADAAVVPFERAAGDLALAAYLVAPPGTELPDARALRAHAAARLPTAMVPAAWVPLEQLPLTPNGKLDRERLPAPERRHLATDEGERRPRTRRERDVVACFERVLGVEPVGVEDDFFALGGHSLLAVTLFDELERVRGGRRLPLATVFEASTPRALAALLGSDAPASRWDNLVPLKPSGDLPPLFTVAAGDGNLVGFGPLARRLSPRQPLYGLQPSGLDGRRPLDRGIEAMVDRYLEALREVQPHGPYLLAGRCNGITVAFELAQRLRAEGEDVPLLASLDSDPPPAGPFELEPGVPFDQLMEVAWARARQAGEEPPGLDAEDGPARLAAWLREPVGPGVSRYLLEAWRWRADLREAWPDPLDEDARSLAEWAWDHGRREHRLVAALLWPRPARDEPPRERLRRARARLARRRREGAAEARARSADALERVLRRPLPGARERIERGVVAAARRARTAYRAQPWPGRILLVTSTEFADKPPYLAWDLRARGGVERRPLGVGHVEMLREPGVAELAACLEDAIGEALGR